MSLSGLRLGSVERMAFHPLVFRVLTFGTYILAEEGAMGQS